MCFLSAEFGMQQDLRKMEVGGVSSRDLYVKREYDCQFKVSNEVFVSSHLHLVIQWLYPYIWPVLMCVG